MAEKLPAGIPPDSGEVTPQGVDNPTAENVCSCPSLGMSQPPEQPEGSVGAPGAAGEDEVSVDKRGRK